MVKELHDWLEREEKNLRAWGEKHDKEGSFPFENFELLKEAGYPRVTVPVSKGGWGAGLSEFLQLQQRLAKADGATALAIGWHAGMIYHVGAYELWEETLFDYLCAQAVDGALFNVAATEKATGSPTRGGRPETTAVRSGSGWVINGRKAFTTMVPVLDFAAVTAVVEESGEVSQFFVPLKQEGIEIEETWDSVAMSGTGSHDLVLTNVQLTEEYRIQPTAQQEEPVNGWLLHIPACYLGIAEAAFDYALDFSTRYSPNSLEGTISETAHVRDKLGRMELLYRQSKAMLYQAAREWEEASFKERSEMKGQLAAVKYTVTNNGAEIVDLAMRVVGARSLSAKSPMQRYYRDIRAGLHNPPMDDAAIALLAEEAISRRNH